ncbi:MAG: alcohol dehydrogenase catalytic domain-containing protein, partial [Deltaproteobacteria bacterium]|nr:alcohol dehydrogenase catalytic domain-containing protein [Deltaproteobacteria bacterium]
MRVVSLDAPGQLRLTERPAPPLAPGHVRVAMRAAGVCSSDIARSHGGAYHHPLVLGHELAGIVQAHGEGAEAPPLGTGVTIFPLLPCFACPPCAEEQYARCLDYDYFGSRRDGGFASNLDVPAWNLLPVPSGVSLDDAALTEPLAVVVHALERLRESREPTRICILGSGFLALLAVAVLQRSPRDVAITVVGRHPHKLQRAEALGARVVSSAEHEAFFDASAGSFDAVLEAVGAPETFAQALALAAPGGRVVWMGNPSG